LSDLAPRTREWGVEILRIDLKDLILPGEMKTLLNRVIEAEKQAAANVIMRREETAATRAQANTAKMMENNPALMRLKELELLSEVAHNVGNITIVAGGDDIVRAFSGRQLASE
ncbi:MAG: SPFH domain-containing protein, partial [Myxococcota bacterium]|nr:SPFH domain-containing protein [Myxococcota bacterium]